MAAVGKFEVPAGAIDGVNTVFVVSLPYMANSVAVFINGQLKNRTFDDGWTETNPAGGVVTLDEPPRLGEVVQIFFIDASPGAGDTVEVSPLIGRLVFVDDVQAVMLVTQEMKAEAVSMDLLQGVVFPVEIVAQLVEAEPLHGLLSEACE